MYCFQLLGYCCRAEMSEKSVEHKYHTISKEANSVLLNTYCNQCLYSYKVIQAWKESRSGTQ